MKRTLLVCVDDLTSRLVAQALVRDCHLVGIVITRNKGLISKLMYRTRRLGAVSVLSQLICAVLARLLFILRGGGQRTKEILNEIGLPPSWPSNVETALLPSDVNSGECMERIRQAVPDLVVVNGTSIIRPPILQCVNAPFINLHCGITPRYRGVHGAFWALWERNPSLAGVTLHHIDEGVDTGQVIGQAVVEVTPKDGFLSLPLCQYKAGINLLKDYLKNIELRSVYTDKLISKQWFYPTLRQYIKFLVTTSLKY